jgi:hypothetical protein
MSDAESRPGVWVVPALVVVLLLTVSAFFLVGHFASRSKAFDWELASIFGTPSELSC